MYIYLIFLKAFDLPFNVWHPECVVHDTNPFQLLRSISFLPMNRVGWHECLKGWDLYFALSELSEIPSPDISSQLSMKSALWINLNFSSLFNFLIPTLQYSVKSLANRYDCIDVPRGKKMYIYAPDIFLVSILNECSISITVLMCHREMYIYAPDNFLNEWMK